MDENISVCKMDEVVNVEYEIIVNERVILKGQDLDGLINMARLMYPDKSIGIRKKINKNY